MLLGAIYLRPALIQNSVANVVEKYKEIETAIDSVLNNRGWIPSEFQIILRGDSNTNLDDVKYQNKIWE